MGRRRIPSPRPPRMRILAGAALALGLGGCFDPPGSPVLFSCDPDAAPACPPGYSCEADGCCHRDGGDVEAHLNECRIGDPGGTATDGPTGTSGTSATTTSGPGTAGSDGSGGSSGGMSGTTSGGGATETGGPGGTGTAGTSGTGAASETGDPSGTGATASSGSTG